MNSSRPKRHKLKREKERSQYKRRNSFTQEPNEITQALMVCRMNKAESCIFQAIKRNSLGYHFNEASLSMRSLATLTGFNVNTVRESYRNLIARRILIELSPGRGSVPPLQKINLEVEEWKLD